MAEILVRPLAADDWTVKRDLRLGALLESPAAFGSRYADTVGRTEAQWREWPSTGAVFGAWLSGLPAGLVGVMPDGDLATVFSMWVAPDARGTSVGDWLLAAVFDWAATHGHIAVALEVASGNDRAERFYARHGFTRTGEPAASCEGFAMRAELPVDSR